MKNNFTISNLLIYISAIFTIVAYVNPNLYILGINKHFLNSGDYIVYFIQFFTGTFLHGGVLHLFMNSIFIYYFGNTVEALIGRKKFIIFFIFSTIFIGINLTSLTYDNTVGISGFAMAVLTYFTLELRRRKNPEYKGGITAIVLNIGIGLLPQISLYGHLFGAIAGVLFYLINKDYLKKSFVGMWLKNKKMLEY